MGLLTISTVKNFEFHKSKMADGRHFKNWRPSAILDLWNSKFLTVGTVKRNILHQRTKFRKDRSNRCGDIVIYVIFKMAAAAILDFQKLEILTIDPL